MAFDKSRRRTCASAGAITTQLLLSFLAVSAPASAAWSNNYWGAVDQAPLLPFAPAPVASTTGRHHAALSESRDHRFTLRHVFHRGTAKYPSLHRRLDVNPAKISRAAAAELYEEEGVGAFEASSARLPIQRLRERGVDDIQSLLQSAQYFGRAASLPESAWTVDDVLVPDIEDQETVVNIALMAGNAYNRDSEDDNWEDVKHPFNLSSDVGWERDGIRGHVFADETNTTIVIAIKGTSSAVFDGAETTTNDKENDNLFAGCCCGQGEHYLWRQVCDCMTSAYSCNDTCVTKELKQPSRYYASSLELYGNITEMYPATNVWVTGHSLGGGVAGLLALTVGIPAVTFEALPQALAASRLGLPVPPGYGYGSTAEPGKDVGIYNFGHTADPVYMGTCNSASSLCTIAGYSLQSQCHSGMRCVYDVVEDLKWRMSLTTHGIRGCIKDVYRAYDHPPTCVPDDECVDCFNWKRYQSNGSEITTTASTTSTSTTEATTRTETCQTPGWWGCRDESTTTTSTTSSTTTTTTATITTTTCISRGWFGNCLDETTTISTTTVTLPEATQVITTSEINPSYLSSSSSSSSSVTATTCHTPGFLYGCKDKPTTTALDVTKTVTDTHKITAAPRRGH